MKFQHKLAKDLGPDIIKPNMMNRQSYDGLVEENGTPLEIVMKVV